jgi:hypothetical protein
MCHSSCKVLEHALSGMAFFQSVAIMSQISTETKREMIIVEELIGRLDRGSMFFKNSAKQEVKHKKR